MTSKDDSKQIPGNNAPADTAAEYGSEKVAVTPEDETFFRQISIEFLVHELKGPASIIESSAKMVLHKKGESALKTGQTRTLKRILRNARKTQTILAQLLEVGRAQKACFDCHAFSPVPVLYQALDEAAETTAPELYDQFDNEVQPTRKNALLSQNGIRLDASDEAAGITLKQDETKFRQIIGNLIKNGLHYKRRHLLIRAVCRQQTFSVSVRDDGPGIAVVHHEAIFQRYRQIVPCEGIARAGHGLGLAVSRILARSMGGDIHIESDLGQGALFRFDLPIHFPDQADR